MPRSPRLAIIALAALAIGRGAPAHAASPGEDTWLTGLTDRVITDLAAGRPLVVEVHAPLCDNRILACGNAKLGDGDNPETNLYWSTTPGLGTWFARKGGGWTRVLRQRAGETGDPDVLAVHAYRRTLATPRAWRTRGAPRTLEIVVVIHGWRGTAIDRALAAYAADLSGQEARTIRLADGAVIEAGGAAQLVAWVGHNRLMDGAAFSWPAPGPTPKGVIAIACHTAGYMAEAVSAKTRVPLLMTRDFLFANAAPLEAAVLAFASGGSYATMRVRAATAYAEVQHRPVKRVVGAFTNPADRRWANR